MGDSDLIFLAKPNQTYQEHIELACTAWADIIKYKEAQIANICLSYNIPKERFLSGSFLTVVLHDIGKMTESFQGLMNKIRLDPNAKPEKTFRHELASLPFALYLSNQLNSKDKIFDNFPLEAFVILGHHKRISSDLLVFEKEKSEQIKPNFIQEGVKQALNLAYSKLESQDIYFEGKFDQFSNLEKQPVLFSTYLIDNLSKLSIEMDSDKKIQEGFRDCYALMKAILHYSDWHASGGREINYKITVPKSEFQNKLGFDLREFQVKSSKQSDNVIAIAPTGSGKTEASILWALNNLEHNKKSKIIYLLPTMVTANNIYKRLEKHFGEDNVGLSHSSASYYLEDDKESKDYFSELYNKTFIKPITVATVDQLLYSGFNINKWSLLEANASNATIVIDEVHCYDGWTLGLICKTINHYKKLGAKFYIMSATMPESLIKCLDFELEGDYKLIKDEELLNASRNLYRTIDESILNISELIEAELKKDKKVLVVANTVKQVQELYDKFEQYNPMCYHSKFILKDRKDKDNKIMDKDSEIRFIIATQVIEVSLDIDYDIMFTECAPPDAIIQRAGRVNRKRTKEDSVINILKADENSERIYSKEILSETFKKFGNNQKRLTENELIEIVEEIYKNKVLRDNKEFKDAYAQYSDSQKKNLYILDNIYGDKNSEITRRTDYLQIPVIPLIFQEVVLNSLPKDRHKYEVKMPIWYVNKNKTIKNDIVFCDMEYDDKKGAVLTKEDSIRIF